MAKFSVLITTPPYDSERSYAAQRFVQNAIMSKTHSVEVFFYQQGVYHANRLMHPPSDEYNYLATWRELHQRQQVRLLVCITAASKRGVVSDAIASEMGINGENFDDAFEQAGLGEFFASLHECDHLVQF